MHSETDCLLELSATPQAVAQRAYDLVWRFDFSAPGFCLLDTGPVDSHTLRAWMVHLKQLLSEITQRRTGRPFFFRSMARFHQQETTKLHLDGAPDKSMLMLGYEPSQVQSRLFLGDYTRAAFDLGISPQQFLQDFNSMSRRARKSWLHTSRNCRNRSPAMPAFCSSTTRLCRLLRSGQIRLE